MMIKKYLKLLPLLLLFTLSEASLAASFEEGKAAYLAKDYEKALSILKPLAAEGHQKAQITLGTMYDFGHGVEQDPLQAVNWYEKSAAQGNSDIQHDLGVKYFKGQGIPQDYDKAAAWWRMAADNGVAVSQYNLGIIYTRGLGVEKDNAQAVDWYTQAALQGHPHAQYSLGVMYSFGQGIPQDYAKGIAYFEDAAEQDVAQAQYNLAVLLEHGRGTDVDLEGAKKWYGRASEGGIKQATERLADFKRSETSETTSVSETDTPITPVSTSNDVSTETNKAEVKVSEIPVIKSANEPDTVEAEAVKIEVAKTPEPAMTVKMEEVKDPSMKVVDDYPSPQTKSYKSPPEDHEVISGDVIEKASTSQQEKQIVEIKKKEEEKIEEVKPSPTPVKIAVQKPEISKPEPKAVSAATFSQATDDESWIRAQDPQHYALQMIAFSQEANAVRYIENLELDGEKAIYKSVMSGKTIYKIIYGNFANHQASLKGRRALPQKYRNAKPFPRSFEFIQSDIQN